MYCSQCYGNNAFQAHDVNFCRDVLCCPDCKSVSYPVPSTEDLRKDVARIKERMRSVPNMPEIEKEEETND